MPIEAAGRVVTAMPSREAVAGRFQRKPSGEADTSARDVAHITHRRQPWWLWPHLLNLDAPLVAVAWQDWWGRATGTRLWLCQRVILGLGVWMIYLADHLADTVRSRPCDPATARHAFASFRRGPLLALTVLIAACLVLLSPGALPPGQFCGGLVLLAAAAGYFWLIHRRGWHGWTATVPKEAAVGGMFALGTAFFALCRPAWPSGRLALAVALFGLVCFLNCALITAWERNACDRLDPFSFLNAYPRLAACGLRRSCWWLAGFTTVAGWAMHATIFLPVALGAFLLGVLDCWRHRFSRDALRSLADAVLLTPWVCCGVLAVIG